MRLSFKIAVCLGAIIGNAVLFGARAEDCDSGHGCLIRCDGGCATVYLGSNNSCEKYCVQTSMDSNGFHYSSMINANAVNTHDLSNAEIEGLLKDETVKKKFSAILCPPIPGNARDK
jgi:hypothetical protein